MSPGSPVTSWLRLVEPSGPFFSPSVLRNVFPQGFDLIEPTVARAVRDNFSEWCAGNRDDRRDAAVHDAWIRWVLCDLLGFDEGVLREGQSLPLSVVAHIPAHHERLAPRFAVVNPAERADVGRPRLLITVCQPGTDLERPL